MPILLDCACGARFETDARPGRLVACPDCDRRLTVPAPGHAAVRTSGLALASVVVGLVGLFTVVLTVLAAVLGVAALVSIRRRREELAGRGYAIFGIVLGLVFTPLSLFAFSKAELFEGVRERLLSGDVDRSGPLEVVRPGDSYAVTRPSEKWGVARGELARELQTHPDSLVLAHPGKDVYLEVSVHDVSPWTNLNQCREEVLTWFRPRGPVNLEQPVSHFVHKTSWRLPDQHGMEAEEVVFEFRLFNNRLTNLARILKQKGGNRMYVLRGWAAGRRFPAVERDLRQAQDSFRPLKP